MTPADTAELLALAAAFDRRTVGEADVLAWHATLGDLDADDAKTAVVDHYRRGTEWVMPAHIRDGVRRLRADRLTRADDTDPPDADPDNVVAYLDALRAGRTRKATGTRRMPAGLTVGREVGPA